MSNAKEFKPVDGAYALAAQRLGKHRQQVWRDYQAGKNAAILAAVAKASLDIRKKEAEDRRKYWEAVKRHEEIAKETAAHAAQ